MLHSLPFIFAHTHTCTFPDSFYFFGLFFHFNFSNSHPSVNSFFSRHFIALVLFCVPGRFCCYFNVLMWYAMRIANFEYHTNAYGAFFFVFFFLFYSRGRSFIVIAWIMPAPPPFLRDFRFLLFFSFSVFFFFCFLLFSVALLIDEA